VEEYIRKGEKTSYGKNILVYSITKPELIKFNPIEEKTKNGRKLGLLHRKS